MRASYRTSLSALPSTCPTGPRSALECFLPRNPLAFYLNLPERIAFCTGLFYLPNIPSQPSVPRSIDDSCPEVREISIGPVLRRIPSLLLWQSPSAQLYPHKGSSLAVCGERNFSPAIAIVKKQLLEKVFVKWGLLTMVEYAEGCHNSEAAMRAIGPLC